MMLNRRTCWRPIGALAMLGTLAWAGLPMSVAQAAPRGEAPGNLLVEWRVVSSNRLKERRAAVEAGGVSVSTTDASSEQDVVHSLMVLNGARARLFVGRTVPVTSWQMLMSTSVSPSPNLRSGGNNNVANTGNAASNASSTASSNAPNTVPSNVASNGGGASAQLLSQTVWIDLGQGLNVRAKWPGGAALVELELDAQSKNPVGPGGMLGSPGNFAPDGQVQRQEVSTTVGVRLGQWTVVARSGSQQVQNDRGALSTADLDNQDQQQLEIRVTSP